jgi:hypothetical protein
MPYFGIPIRNGLPIGLGSVAGFGVQQFSPADLFSAGEQGAWYDPSDLTTLFTDSAGTTPVTAVEQFVGLMLDKSKGLVLGSELVTNGDFATNTDWTLGVGASISGGVLEYSGGTSGNTIQTQINQSGATYIVTFTLVSRTSGSVRVRFNGNAEGALQTAPGTYVLYTKSLATNSPIVIETNGSFVGSIDNVSVKLIPGNHATQTTSAKRPKLAARYNLLVGTDTLATQSVTTAATTYTLRFGGTGSIALTGTATGTYSAGTHSITATAGTLTLTVTGSVTTADLRPASQATGLIGPTYQRVVDAATYDAVGFLPYLEFDGIDDSMSTGSIDFTATDKMTVWAGVRKLQDATYPCIAELSANLETNNSSFALFSGNGSAPADAPEWNWASKGTVKANVATTGSLYKAPITSVLTGIGNISGDVATLRVNGVQAATNTGDQGTGNYGNYPIYIGARGGTNLYFTGWLTSLIVRGAQSTQGQIEATESWVNGKTGAY